MRAGSGYGEEVDVYSLSLILYEMFSGEIAFHDQDMLQLVTTIYVNKERPTFTSTFPSQLLRAIIELGWSHDPEDRCKLDDFRETLWQMKIPVSSTDPAPTSQAVSVSMEEQAKTIQLNLLHYSRTIEMKWQSQSDDTTGHIKRMMDEMRKSSSFRNVFNENILNATLCVPKHLFFDLAAFKSLTYDVQDDNDCLDQIYKYDKPLRVNQNQNMSSTEIT